MSDQEGKTAENVMIMTVQGPISPAEVTGMVSCHEYLLINSMQFRGRDEEDNMAVEDGTDLRMLPVSMNILGKLKEDPFCCLDNCVLNQEDNAEAELRYRMFGLNPCI
jgi:predicted metal-dependent phosphotriesterase family hydrolase